MPLVNALRYANRLVVVTDAGVQTVIGTLDISGGATIGFDPAVFTAPGTYTIFTYTLLVGAVRHDTRRQHPHSRRACAR